jgi:hypothetical protein
MSAFIAVSEIVSDSRRALHLIEALRQAGFGRNDIYMIVPSDRPSETDSHPAVRRRPSRLARSVSADQHLPGNGDRIACGGLRGSSARGTPIGSRARSVQRILCWRSVSPNRKPPAIARSIPSGGVLVTGARPTHDGHQARSAEILRPHERVRIGACACCGRNHIARLLVESEGPSRPAPPRRRDATERRVAPAAAPRFGACGTMTR